MTPIDSTAKNDHHSSASSLEVGSIVHLTTSSMASGGGCVARTEDGRVVFVRHSLPGEEVLATITAVSSSFLRADAIEILKASPHRITPRCPHAGPDKCGGCDYQHIDLDEQRRLKALLIAEHLRRIAKIDRTIGVEAVPGDVSGFEWRTRVRFAVDNDGRIGYRKSNSHHIESVERCFIACADITALDLTSLNWQRVSEVEAIVKAETDDSLTHQHLVIATTDDASGKVRLPRLHDETVRVIVKSRRHPPHDHVTYKVHHHEFRVSSASFWQVHHGAATLLVESLLEGLRPQNGERVLDLYSGVGLFTKFLADGVGDSGSVTAVESGNSACSDARHNTSGQSQVSIVRANINRNLIQSLKSCDLVVLDPPRSGFGIANMRTLLATQPHLRRIAYVSCDPATFARDVAVATEAGWQMTQLRAFDLFPQTEHVEILAFLDPPL